MTNKNPPHGNLPILEKVKALYKFWLPLRRNFPRTEQFGIGAKVDNLFLDLLETLRLATFTSGNEKIALLYKGILKTDSLRFFIQLCLETNLLTSNQFLPLGEAIETVGKMIGGWKRGYLTKTPANTTGEKKK